MIIMGGLELHHTSVLVVGVWHLMVSICVSVIDDELNTHSTHRSHFMPT